MCSASSALTLALVFCSASPASDRQLAEVVDLGVASKAVVYENTEGTIGPSPEGGHPIFYMSYYQTGGAELLAYDQKSKKVFRWDLPGGQGGYGMATGADGKIYVGMIGQGNLMQFDPATQTLRDLGKAGQPTTYVWSCATGPDGKIFGAGYPKCIPLIYDPKTDKLSSPGSISPRPGTDYLRCVAADAKGRAWFGVGSRAALVVYDPADQSHRNVLPDEYADQSTVYELVHSAGYVYASILYSGKVLVFEAESCRFVREIPPPPGEGGMMATVADSKGNVYCFSGPSGNLYVIRPGSWSVKKLASHLGAVKTLLDDRYLHLIFDNDRIIYDLDKRQVVERQRWIEPKAGMIIMSTLTQGPEGKIYGSTYINQHFFRYDPADGQLTDMGRIIRSGGQCDSMGRSRDGKRLWMGCYANGYLAMYDPARPIKLGSGPDCNPRDFGILGKGQYRTRATVEGPLGKIYCGSIPSYNSGPTGALTIFAPKTLHKNVITDLVPGGAVYKLASDDRFVYGSGGGKLFALDPKTARKVNQRDLSCSALLIGPDGTLLASAAGAVQGIDTDTLATRWSIPFSQVENLKGFSRMILGPKKEIYGVGGQGIFRIDVAGSKLIQLTNIPSGNLAADSEGRLYFSKGANLYMVDPLAK